MVTVSFRMASTYCFWPMVLGFTGRPLDVMQITSWVSSPMRSDWPLRHRPTTYRTCCSLMLSPLADRVSRACTAFSASMTFSGSPEITSSPPRFTTVTWNSDSSRRIFSSKEPNRLMASSMRSMPMRCSIGHASLLYIQIV